MDARTVAIVILLVALAGFAVAYYVVGPGKRKGLQRRGDVPLAMRPYHSDDELESTALERAMAWGVALSLFMAFFLPIYWLIEPQRIDDKVDQYYQEDVDNGRLLFAEACASCHGAEGEGGVAPHPDPDIEAPWPAPRLNNIAARYADNKNVADVERLVYETIERGRPGTPMPAWGAGFGGPFTDQAVNQITRYVLSIQQDDVAEAQAYIGLSGEDLYGDNCARCHGPNAEGYQGDTGGYDYVGPTLLNVFERYGADGTPEGDGEAREAIIHTLQKGRMVPTGANMPAWEDVLSQSAIERIVDYLQSIQR